MAKVLVTGATGFIGKRLCLHLQGLGHEVWGTTRTAINPDLVPFHPIQIDLTTQDNRWDNLLNGVDTIFHLAAYVHQPQKRHSDLVTECRKMNFESTVRLATAASLNSVRKFIFLSTIKVNGEGLENHDYLETDLPSPKDPYGWSKLKAEEALATLSKQTGIEIVCLRPPLVYGEEVRANFLSLLKIIKKGWPLPFKNIKNRRSLIYVGNLVHALKTCMEKENASGKTYLISDGEDISTPALINQIAQIMKVPSRLFSFPPFLYKVMGKVTFQEGTLKRLTGSLSVNSEKIRNDLDFSPPYSLKVGLEKTVIWFLTQHG
ncbi:MAG TPA: NAD-dependent dehydratase [Deltaproteobacteria bacterium]|nr:NAD-dependent dehydratase [Deltaproteobacteria bacterium]